MHSTALRRAAALAAAALVAAGLAACQGADGGRAAPAPGAGTATVEQTTPAPVVEVAPADGEADVRPDATVRVHVSDGTLVDVRVAPADAGAPAEPLAGSLEGGSWTASGALAPGTGYQVVATVVDAAGQRSEHRTSFGTLTPQDTTDPYLVPGDGWTVGVGMPVVVDFETAVQDRAAVERALSVQTSPQQLEGAWRWISDRQVQWRPRDYWPSGTHATLRAALASVEVAPGVWGARDREVSFEVGSAMVSTVDLDSQQMTVERDGQLLRTIPVSTGKAGYETRTGTKVIMSRHSEYRMDAATTGVDPGDPNYYDVDVKYAMRLTYSGEFIHAAPWTDRQQGRTRASHGCTGVSTENARWLFESSKVGDVVRFVGSGPGLERDNGYTAWEMSFEDWKAGSALTD